MHSWDLHYVRAAVDDRDRLSVEARTQLDLQLARLRFAPWQVGVYVIPLECWQAEFGDHGSLDYMIDGDRHVITVVRCRWTVAALPGADEVRRWPGPVAGGRTTSVV
jgi:hypothetical protein